jgi:8-oxo-dGTP pyrophosphatase MutT (NUDIX family)
MKHVTLTFEMKVIPKVATRGEHAMIVVRDNEGRFILGQKKIYPKGIVRFVGGGIEKDEDPLTGAHRELLEETGIYANEKELKELVKITSNISEDGKKNYIFTVYLYLIEIDLRGIRPSSDLDNVVRLTEAELEDLVIKYSTLSKKLDPKVNFSWYDYGQLFGSIHRIGLEAVRKYDAKKEKDES